MAETLLGLDPRLHIIALALYALATAGVILGWSDDTSWWRRAGTVCFVLGVAVHTTALGARWIGSGHGPYVTRYEILSSNAWFTAIIALVAARQSGLMKKLSAILYPAICLLIALGLYTGPEVQMLPPTFSGVWLVVHVCFYFVAFATALVAVAASAVFLIRARSESSWAARFGEPEDIDSLAYRFAGLAFAFWGIGMLAGSIWAYYAWGRFWGWDPVETWSLVTWIAFGLYLHLRRFFGWSGVRAAVLLVACFLLADGTLFFTSLIDGSLHAVYFR